MSSHHPVQQSEGIGGLFEGLKLLKEREKVAKEKGIEKGREDEDSDLYSVIGSVPSSTKEQITAEYKARAILLHPDKHSGSSNHSSSSSDPAKTLKQFQRLQRAYEVLSDDAERKLYDEYCSSGMKLMSYQKWKMLKQQGHTFHWREEKAPQNRLTAGEEEKKPEPVIQKPMTSDDLYKMFREYRV